jgi:hypothetical protein
VRSRRVAHFDNLDGEVGEGVEQAFPPAPRPFVTVIAAIDDDDARDGLHVTVHVRQNGIEIAPVEAWMTR